MDRIVTLAATIKVAIAVALAAALLGAWCAWTVQGWRLDAQEASFTRAVNEARNRQEVRAEDASSDHAQHAEAIRTEAQIIYREVPRVVEKPVYRNVCIDPDGLRLISRAIRGSGGAGQPAPAVPGVAGAD